MQNRTALQRILMEKQASQSIFDIANDAAAGQTLKGFQGLAQNPWADAASAQPSAEGSRTIWESLKAAVDSGLITANQAKEIGMQKLQEAGAKASELLASGGQYVQDLYGDSVDALTKAYTTGKDALPGLYDQAGFGGARGIATGAALGGAAGTGIGVLAGAPGKGAIIGTAAGAGAGSGATASDQINEALKLNNPDLAKAIGAVTGGLGGGLLAHLGVKATQGKK